MTDITNIKDIIKAKIEENIRDKLSPEDIVFVSNLGIVFAFSLLFILTSILIMSFILFYTKCCNPYHLELGTPIKNSEYMVKCNRQNTPTGENNGRAILTEDEVRKIHKIHKDHPGLKQWQIAEMFKIDQARVSSILNGKRWHNIYNEFKSI